MTSRKQTPLSPALSFPSGFAWGVATSAYQIEGAVDVDGRTPSIWDTFSHLPGTIDNGDNGDVACESYVRWPEDLKMLQQLGVDSYRFSVAWPRIQPQPGGAANAKGIAYYDRIIDDLLGAGITPMLTAYHWDLPQYLQDAGGWPARDTALRFAEYAGVLAAAYGDRVSNWVTLNEPLCSAWIGHLEGKMAPGITDITQAVPASYHLLLAHGLGAQAIRANAAVAPKVGLVVNLNHCVPASDSPEDVAAAVRSDGHSNRWWLDPIYGKGFPADMVELYGVDLPVQEGDLETIATPTEFLGINYYFRNVVRDDQDATFPFATQVELPDAPKTAMGWEVNAHSLEEMLVRVAADYSPAAIQITENGSAYVDTVGADGLVDDPERTDYLLGHLEACSNAIARGVPLTGYYAWSLLDNFEWAYGYDKRFGLVHVDFDTQARTLKSSGLAYSQIVRDQRG